MFLLNIFNWGTDISYKIIPIEHGLLCTSDWFSDNFVPTYILHSITGLGSKRIINLF